MENLCGMEWCGYVHSRGLSYASRHDAAELARMLLLYPSGVLGPYIIVYSPILFQVFSEKRFNSVERNDVHPVI